MANDIAIPLKGGHHTTDPRLDRLPRWDVRNEAYGIRALVSPAQAVAPRSYTWRCATFLDQGAEGACVGFSWTHELAARPVVQPGLTDQYARDLYHAAQVIDPWPGGSYPGADPVYEGTDVLSAAKILQTRGMFSEYRWALDINDLILAVGYKGPAVLGVNWYEGMFYPDAEGYIHVSGQVAGGHAILCNGVNLPGRYFKLHNSWGQAWGVQGACRVSFADMERLLGEFGEACIPVGRRMVRS